MIKLNSCVHCKTGAMAQNRYGEWECIICGYVDYPESLPKGPQQKNDWHGVFIDGCCFWPISCETCVHPDCIWEYEPDKRKPIWKKLNTLFNWPKVLEYIEELKKRKEELEEDGADAILESLKKEGFHTENLAKKWRTKVFGNKLGWVVFIPDKKEKKNGEI